MWVRSVAGELGLEGVALLAALYASQGSWFPSFLLKTEMVSQLFSDCGKDSNSHSDPALQCVFKSHSQKLNQESTSLALSIMVGSISVS